ncbi:hypothetical protein SLS55_009238 [Diplodia seriata]|uniref:Uncharacterized protein n=1 Tax=Diplodia seriata TaxID=420778 RepID=A0ABR3C3K7_9PEZI
MDGTLLKRVKQVQHDGITSVLESATEPRGMDCEPVVPAVLTQPRLISAKGLDNLQLSDAIPQQDAGEASTPGRPKDETRFMRNLRKQMEEKARTTRMKRNDDGRECADDDDPDRTLVDMIEDAFDMDSAEDKSSTALVSSTDAESNGHYEKMEWERSLKPHQRDIFDVLTRISRHFVRHLIDSETAIEDILQDFEADGTRLIELMEETHRKEYDTQRKCLLEARTHLSRALLRIKDQVVEHERQARITLLSNSWEKEESVSKKHISHLEKMLNQMADP